jgi:hypothetical protein
MKEEHCKLIGITTKSGFLHDMHLLDVDYCYAALLMLQNLFFVAIRITPARKKDSSRFTKFKFLNKNNNSLLTFSPALAIDDSAYLYQLLHTRITVF